MLPTDLACALDRVDLLPPGDRPAAEALAAAMAGWSPGELADYRAAVLAEVAARDRRPVDGFLAVEVAALLAVGGSAA